MLVNCWVVLLCSVDACLVIGASHSPKNVLFCCLALVFLFNLDDVDGSLDFVSGDDWPGGELGWMNYMVQRQEQKGFLESIHASDGVVAFLFDIVAVSVGLMAVVGPVCSNDSHSCDCPVRKQVKFVVVLLDVSQSGGLHVPQLP